MRSRISYWPKRSGPDVDTVPVASAGRGTTTAGDGLAGVGGAAGAAGAAAGFARAAILMPESVSEIMRSISVSVEKRGAGAAGASADAGGETCGAAEAAGAARGAERLARIPDSVSR